MEQPVGAARGCAEHLLRTWLWEASVIIITHLQISWYVCPPTCSLFQLCGTAPSKHVLPAYLHLLGNVKGHKQVAQARGAISISEIITYLFQPWGINFKQWQRGHSNYGSAVFVDGSNIGT